MWFSITPHSANPNSVEAVSTLLTSMHQAYRDKRVTELVIAGQGDGTRLLANVPDSLHSIFKANAADLLPDSRVEPCNQSETRKQVHLIATLRLVPECFSISTNDGESSDLAAAMLSALRCGRSGTIDTRVRLQIRPTSGKRRKQMKSMIGQLGYRLRFDWLNRIYVHLIHSRRWLGVALANQLPRLARAKRKPIHPHEERLASHLYECLVTAEVAGPEKARSVLQTKMADIVGSLGAFTDDVAGFSIASQNGRIPKDWRYSSLFSPNELAQIWHPPIGRLRVANVARSPIVELEPPNLQREPGHQSGVMLGRVVYRRQKDRVEVSNQARLRHAFVIGKTGCGKSTLLQNMIVDDLRNNRGVCVVDPHGDLIDTLLDLVPPRRTNDVLLLDAGDQKYPVGFNPLSTSGRLDPTLVADGVLTAVQKVFGMEAATAPRLLHIFRNCLLALIGHRDDATLISVQRMLTDDSFRKSIVARIQNPAVRQFWESEFARWRPADRTAFVASLQNKLGAYLSNTMLAGIFGQTKNQLDFRHLMDNRKIVFVNLSKGRVGSDASSLLGALIVSSLQTAALSRAELPERERTEFFVYLDEFSTFVSEGNDTFATILSESRKYKTGYTLVTQFVDQLDQQTRSAVFGNCGSLIAMQCGIDDSRIMAEQLGELVTPQMVAELPRYHAYGRLLLDGTPTKPFAMQTLPPPKRTQNRSDIVRKVSRRAHGRPRNEVEAEIRTAYDG
jgi:energy-coupling factor transporter ATP-binding protein EcfA2